MDRNGNKNEETTSLSHSFMCLLIHLEHKFWRTLLLISEIGKGWLNFDFLQLLSKPFPFTIFFITD